MPSLLLRSVTSVAENNSTTPRTHRPHPPKFSRVQNQPISNLVPYSGLILTCIVCTLVIIRLYVFERLLFPRMYGQLWRNMADDVKRTFINHHIGGLIKIILLVAGAYPWVHVLFEGNEDFHTPMARGSMVSMGDVLLVLTQLFCSMYVFELLIRSKLSPVAMAHHVGAVVIAQVAVALSLRLDKERDATIEYMLCLVWGAFDVLAEFWPNLAIILYRTKSDNHYLLKNVFLATAVITLMGTVAETIMIFVFLGSVWGKLSLDFKVATPILHCVFMVAQMHGSRILFSMYKSQVKKLQSADMADLEAVAIQAKGQEPNSEPSASEGFTNSAPSAPGAEAVATNTTTTLR